MIVRPPKGGHVPLEDDDLARIGLTVAYESAAKAIVASILRSISHLGENDWIKLERTPFAQILTRLETDVTRVDDAELCKRFAELQDAISAGHESRHISCTLYGERAAMAFSVTTFHVNEK